MWINVYEGEGEEQTPATPEVPKTLKDFLQAVPDAQNELNAMMAENRKKLTKTNSEMIRQLEELRDAKNMTEQQKEELQERIEHLEQQYMTKEELAKREQGKLQKEYEKNLQNINNDLEMWRDLHTSSTINGELYSEAVKAKAHNPQLIVDILGPKTRLEKVLGEDGAPIPRQYAPITNFNDTDEEGNKKELQLSPAKAIARMKELPELYGHLFEGLKTSGLGADSGSSTGTGKGAATIEALKDPKVYQEWRKNNPDLDLSKLGR